MIISVDLFFIRKFPGHIFLFGKLTIKLVQPDRTVSLSVYSCFYFIQFFLQTLSNIYSEMFPFTFSKCKHTTYNSWKCQQTPEYNWKGTKNYLQLLSKIMSLWICMGVPRVYYISDIFLLEVYFGKLLIRFKMKRFNLANHYHHIVGKL